MACRLWCSGVVVGVARKLQPILRCVAERPCLGTTRPRCPLVRARQTCHQIVAVVRFRHGACRARRCSAAMPSFPLRCAQPAARRDEVGAGRVAHSDWPGGGCVSSGGWPAQGRARENISHMRGRGPHLRGFFIGRPAASPTPSRAQTWTKSGQVLTKVG